MEKLDYSPFRNQIPNKVLPEPISNLKGYVWEARAFIKANPLVVRYNRKGYAYCLKRENQTQFSMLEKAGLMRFHITNRGNIFMLHQINMFLWGSGWKWYLKGYTASEGEVDIHHLDRNTLNNDPRNLRYVSPQLNKLCSEALGQKHNGPNPKKTMTESLLGAAKIIQLSVNRFFLSLGIHSPNIPIARWLLNLPGNIRDAVIIHWAPLEEVRQRLKTLTTKPKRVA